MSHYYPNVPGMGNIALSRHAQERMESEGISRQMFEDVLFGDDALDIPDGQDVTIREGQGIGIVILLKPEPFAGAKLVATVYRIKDKAKTK